MTWRAFLLLALCLVFGAASARAATVSFAATVRSVAPGAPYPAVGASISGTYVFDADPSIPLTGGSPLEGPTYAYYQYVGASYGLDSSLTRPAGLTGGLAIEVFDDGSRLFPSDFPSDAISLNTKRANVSYSLILLGPNSSFAGTALPSAATWESFWTSATFSIQDNNLDLGRPALVATVSSVSVNVVPEPATWLLLALAPLAFGRSGASRRHGRAGSHGSRRAETIAAFARTPP